MFTAFESIGIGDQLHQAGGWYEVLHNEVFVHKEHVKHLQVEAHLRQLIETMTQSNVINVNDYLPVHNVGNSPLRL